MMKRLILVVVVALSVLALAPSAHGRAMRWSEEIEIKAYERKKEALALNKVQNLRQLLSDQRVDQITNLAEYRAYQKKINKILRYLLKDSINAE
jgi:hypothetical protein